MDKTARATDKEAAALGTLLGRIDPVLAATKRLDQMEAHFDKFYAVGKAMAAHGG